MWSFPYFYAVLYKMGSIVFQNSAYTIFSLLFVGVPTLTGGIDKSELKL